MSFRQTLTFNLRNSSAPPPSSPREGVGTLALTFARVFRAGRGGGKASGKFPGRTGGSGWWISYMVFIPRRHKINTSQLIRHFHHNEHERCLEGPISGPGILGAKSSAAGEKQSQEETHGLLARFPSGKVFHQRKSLVPPPPLPRDLVCWSLPSPQKGKVIIASNEASPFARVDFLMKWDSNIRRRVGGRGGSDILVKTKCFGNWMMRSQIRLAILLAGKIFREAVANIFQSSCRPYIFNKIKIFIEIEI